MIFGLLKDGSSRLTWTEINPGDLSTMGLPGSRMPRGFYGGNAFVVNGKMYAGLGSNFENLYQHDMSAASPYDWKWVSETAYAGLCVHYASHFVIGNYVYIVGGSTSCSSNAGDKKVFRINPASGVLVPVADLPESPTRSSAFSHKGKGYVVTGNGSFFEYDPVGNTWSKKASTGIASRYAVVLNGKFYSWSNVGEVFEYTSGN